MNAALLQLPPVAPNDVRLSKYLQSCKKQKVQIVVFGEYIFHPFYRDISLKDSKAFASFCKKILNALHKLSVKYKLDMVVPLINYHESKVYKDIALIQGEKVHLYHQQRLIAYPHWNEKQFFYNILPKSPKTPLIFEKEDIRFGIIAGFEIHFDEIWLKLKQAQVDVVIMPCSNTFASKERWRILSQARAFTNSMVILRVNGIDEKVYDDVAWKFYGDSCLIDADGHIDDTLEEREGMMIVELQAQHVKNIQKEWGFR